MSSRISIVTGATGKIGRVIAEEVVRQGKHLVIACRSLAKSKVLLDDLQSAFPHASIESIMLDLSDRRSIKRFAETIEQKCYIVSELVCAAGLLCQYESQSKDDIDMSMTVNYLGNVRLIESLQYSLAHDAKIINMVSLAMRWGTISGNPFLPDERFNRFRRYASSKLALYAYTQHLARKYDNTNISVYAVDPGIVNTVMITRGRWFEGIADSLLSPFVRTPEKGAETVLYLLSNRPQTTGVTYFDCQIKQFPSDMFTREEWSQLWESTQKYLTENV
ncbi:MAG: SDR family NAD(P)-dependent oxidoreductase [Paludibacteraceae bacterium]|nr:SDR family NAD(P)-dependent oxidoreductase [Paludibacteraceae bacterium]